MSINNFIILMITFAMCGCYSTVSNIQDSNSKLDQSGIEYNQIHTDRTLRSKVEVTRVNESFVSGNIKKVQAVVSNKSSKKLNVKYSFEWYDENGMSLRSTSSSWKLVFLNGKEEKPIQSVAPSEKAVDFKLKLKE